jgi:two-component system, response regulator RegA
VAKRTELLLVDASLGQRAVLQRMLVANGFTVAAFPDLGKPGARIVTRRFDHAVLDLRVSDRGGLDSIRSLREARPRARIVVVTDVDSFATVVLALRAGADGFVAKPVDEGELVDALLDRAPPLPPVPQTPLGLHRVCWEHVMRVYELCDRNMTETARRLGMDRRSLQRFLGKRAPPARAAPSVPGDRMPPAHLAGSARRRGPAGDAGRPSEPQTDRWIVPVIAPPPAIRAGREEASQG